MPKVPSPTFSSIRNSSIDAQPAHFFRPSTEPGFTLGVPIDPPRRKEGGSARLGDGRKEVELDGSFAAREGLGLISSSCSSPSSITSLDPLLTG
jgi:hypothetical protein